MNYQKFTGMTVGERILKIGEHLAKLERKNRVAGHGAVLQVTPVFFFCQ